MHNRHRSREGPFFFSSFIDAFKTLSPSCYLISCCSIYFLIHIKKIVFIFWCGERERRQLHTIVNNLLNRAPTSRRRRRRGRSERENGKKTFEPKRKSLLLPSLP